MTILSAGMSKRGSVISVPESWLEQCRRWRDEQQLTIEETGARLSRVVRRGRPFAEATVRRYLSGTLITNELTRAFAQAMGVPAPVVIEDENHQEWHDLGVRLDRANAGLFKVELDRLRKLVEVVEALREYESKQSR